MPTTYILRAADETAMAVLLIQRGIWIDNGQGGTSAATGLGYAAKGAAQIGGAPLVGHFGLMWFTTGANALTQAQQDALLLALTTAGAIYTGPPVIYLLGGAADAPSDRPTEPLAARKYDWIAAINGEVRRRLVEHYGDALEQCTRFAGGYGATAQTNILAGTTATIAASNVAQAAINAATTAAQVEAVTVTWPVLV